MMSLTHAPQRSRQGPILSSPTPLKRLALILNRVCSFAGAWTVMSRPPSAAAVARIRVFSLSIWKPGRKKRSSRREMPLPQKSKTVHRPCAQSRFSSSETRPLMSSSVAQTAVMTP